MEKLKSLFGEESLSFKQFTQKLEEGKGIKLADISDGDYVARKKYEDLKGELETANSTIGTLNETVKKFDGVNVEDLQDRIKKLSDDHETELKKVKLDGALDIALEKAKARDAELVKKTLDMDMIKLDGDNVVGLKEQIETLQKDKSYLFDIKNDSGEDESARVNTGGSHEDGEGDDDTFLTGVREAAGLEASS